MNVWFSEHWIISGIPAGAKTEQQGQEVMYESELEL